MASIHVSYAFSFLFFFFICFSLIYNPHEYHLVYKVFLKITQSILWQRPSVCVGIKSECWLNS